MKIWIKIVIAGIVGFGGGFASGFFAHKKMNDVQFQEISDEEMQEIESSMTKKETVEETINRTFDPVRDIQEIPENPDELRNALQGKTPYIQADAEQKKAYEKMWESTKEYSNVENADRIPVLRSEGVDPYGEDEEGNDDDFDSDFMEEIADEDSSESFDHPDPYRITFNEFFNERPEYDKITIYFYESDNLWVDDHNDIIHDIESYIGSNVSTLFSYTMPGDEEDLRFIRNESYSTDYEVVRHKRSREELEEDNR